MDKKYKPVLRRCSSNDSAIGKNIFAAHKKPFTFPNTTYWASDRWSKVIEKLKEGFLYAKFQLDEEDKKHDIYMKELCEQHYLDWVVVKKINNWRMYIKPTKKSLKVQVWSKNEHTEICIRPFLDDDNLAVEIKRWNGSAILMHRWLKYVIKYLEDFLHKRE